MSSSRSSYHHTARSGGSGSRTSSTTIRPEGSDDWNPYRDTISYLYSRMTLKDLVVHMKTTYNFKATDKQYKTQIKKWALDTKYTKASEYLAMIKTQRRRERETPGKQTRFTLRGRPIDPKDIARFKKRAIKKGEYVDDVDDADADAKDSEGAEYIEDLGYETPSPTSSVTTFQHAGQDSAAARHASSHAQPAADGVGSIGYLLSYDPYPPMDTGERAMSEYQRRR